MNPLRARIYISGWYRVSAEALREDIEKFLTKGQETGEFRKDLEIDGLRVFSYLGEKRSNYTVVFESSNLEASDFTIAGITDLSELHAAQASLRPKVIRF